MAEHKKHPVLDLKKRDRDQIMIHGVLVFLGTAFLSLMGVRKIASIGCYTPSASVSVQYFLALFFIATLLLLLTLKVTKKSALFEILFTIAILSGAWFLADIFLPEGLALIVGSGVILLRFIWKAVLPMNISLAVGIAGISASVGSGLSPNGLLIILTVLVFYDILAVYSTKHMVRMFRDLVSRGVVFAFALTPFRRDVLLGKTKDMQNDPVSMLLGTGDVALPMMFAVSAAGFRMEYGIAASLGATVGFIIMFKLFLGQRRRKPMPALPPIALGTVIFYLISILVFPV